VAQEIRTNLKESDPQLESITYIEQEALRCRKIVLDLLDFVRPAEASFVPVDVGEMIQSTVSLLAARFRKSDIETRVYIEPDLPRVIADPQQLRQVLVNLAFNGAEAMPKGGILSFRALTAQAATGEPQQKDQSKFSLTVAVADTGIGIDSESLPDIFRPFFTTKKGKGMGLGLSVCERIVKAHRGKIKVESAPGKGTTFYLHFPAAEVKQHERAS
jgi:two-component system NtrC family sensor kinase